MLTRRACESSKLLTACDSSSTKPYVCPIRPALFFMMRTLDVDRRTYGARSPTITSGGVNRVMRFSIIAVKNNKGGGQQRKGRKKKKKKR